MWVMMFTSDSQMLRAYGQTGPSSTLTEDSDQVNERLYEVSYKEWCKEM